ncbi:unnamed protein product [Acanthosepion pharaonis]|uniref:Uncharacterized protein n=1 Tax=Acanthosepion pharaonis TaxID=158019 RepID=A0A812CNV0_ACAPH|nr:unnamed protein product [Sepia pharaonis]
MLVLLLSSFQLLTTVSSSIEHACTTYFPLSIANNSFPSSIEACLYYFFPLSNCNNNSFLLFFQLRPSSIGTSTTSFLFLLQLNSFLLQLRHASTTSFLFPIANNTLNSFLLQLRHASTTSFPIALFFLLTIFLLQLRHACTTFFPLPIANNSFLLQLLFLLQLRHFFY